MAQLLHALAPLAGLAALALAGAGATVVLAARLPRDAQAALMPVVGAAVFACASQLVELGLPVGATVSALLLLSAALAVRLRRPVLAALGSCGLPLAVALAALMLAAMPQLVRGSWEAAAHQNSDVYLRVSQARALTAGAAPSPASDFPDRLAYERLAEQGWAVGIPFGHASVAWVARADPARVQGLLAALLVALAPLAAFALARGCLGWGRGAAAAAGLVLAANAQLLSASFHGWLPQLAATAFALAAAGALRLALDEEGGLRERVLVALLGAAALSVYRLPFAPVLAGLLGAVLVGYALAHRRRLRHALGVAASCAALLALFAAVSVVDLARGLPRFLSGQLAEEGWAGIAPGEPAHALGLVTRPTVYRVAAGPEEYAVALGVAVLFLLAGLTAIRGRPRSDLLLAGAVFFLASAGVLRLLGASGYLSFKLLGLGAPFLVLLAVLGAGAGGRRVLPAAAAVLALGLVAFSAHRTIDHAVASQTAVGHVAELAEILGELPPGRIAVDVDDVWRQSWILYYLRDRPVSVESPSIVLTGIGLRREASHFRHRPFDYLLAGYELEGALWAGEGLWLATASRLPAARVAGAAAPMLTPWRSPSPATSAASPRSPRSRSDTASATSSSATA